MTINTRHYLPSNFPTKPTPALPTILSFPRDIVADNRNFYIQIDFVDYNSLSWNYVSGNTTKFPNPTGGLILPLPKKINDTQTVIWEEASATGMASALHSGVGSIRSNIASPFGGALGISPNPFLWMLFRTPDFKSFNLSWTLAPNNQQESQDIMKIINKFKYAQLPIAEGPVYFYPSIAMIKMYPNDIFTVKFRPCAIIRVSVDFTAAGGPSFFKNGCPTIINLSVDIKEIELWTKGNFNNGDYDSIAATNLSTNPTATPQNTGPQVTPPTGF